MYKCISSKAKKLILLKLFFMYYYINKKLVLNILFFTYNKYVKSVRLVFFLHITIIMIYLFVIKLLAIQFDRH